MGTGSLSLVRLYALFVVFVALSLVLAARLSYWQLAQRVDLVAQAQRQVRQAEAILPRRGAVYDRRGSLLATTVSLQSVYAIPQQMPDRAAAAKELAPTLGVDAETLRVRLEGGAEWVYLARRLPEDVSAKVKAEALPGVGLRPEPKRTYPNDAVGAALLGFVTDDGDGQYGLEGRYDATLRGLPGHLVVERDPANRALAVGLREVTAPMDGSDLVLTLDLVIQSAAERELARVVTAERATGGTIVVMDPDSGALLAVASAPGFDPNAVARANPESFRDRAVSSMYEPGSTMKPLTVAAALDAGAIDLTSSYEDKGYAVIGGRVLHNAQGKSYGRLDISGILEKSANAGAVFVAQRLGAEKLYRSFEAFGLGKPTGVDLAFEASGQLRPLRDWYPVDLGTAAFGQGVSVTPLQLATAYAALANGGTLYRPYVVAEQRRSDGTVERAAPQAVRRVVAPETAAAMRRLLTNVIDRGIAHAAAMPGYSVAGKTGTAQIASPDGRYLDDEYISSFAALLPARDPRYVVVVVLERPESRLLGTLSAMSAFKGLAPDLLRVARLDPDR